MDTRSKIGAAITAPATAPVAIGNFDPVTAAEAEALAALGNGLTVIVRNTADELLNWRARAELVAGLRCVSAVISEADASPELLAQAQPIAEERDGLISTIRFKHGR